MALVSLKRTAADKEEEMKEVSMMEQEDYSYGLCLHLDSEELEKLGITNMPKVGSSVMIKAKCLVKSTKQESENGEAMENSMRLQVTDMEIGESMEDRNTNAATMLYSQG